VSFELNPAVRSPESGCVDEGSCDYEKATLCAFDQASETATKVDFLVCMDETKGRLKTGLEAAQPCAQASSLSWSSMTMCFHGQQGSQLLEQASKVFNATLPGRTTIPHTFVNTDDVPPSYTALKSALCEAGSTASVCKSAVEERAVCEL